MDFYEPENMLLIFMLYFSAVQGIKNFSFNGSVKKAAAFLSSYSYSLYLIHYTLITFLKPWIQLNNIEEITLVFAICNIISFGFYLMFERNYKKIRTFIMSINHKKSSIKSSPPNRPDIKISK